jgi:hypothetical protein
MIARVSRFLIATAVPPMMKKRCRSAGTLYAGVAI